MTNLKSDTAQELPLDKGPEGPFREAVIVRARDRMPFSGEITYRYPSLSAAEPERVAQAFVLNRAFTGSNFSITHPAMLSDLGDKASAEVESKLIRLAQRPNLDQETIRALIDLNHPFLACSVWQGNKDHIEPEDYPRLLRTLRSKTYSQYFKHEGLGQADIDRALYQLQSSCLPEFSDECALVLAKVGNENDLLSGFISKSQNPSQLIERIVDTIDMGDNSALKDKIKSLACHPATSEATFRKILEKHPEAAYWALPENDRSEHRHPYFKPENYLSLFQAMMTACDKNSFTYFRHKEQALRFKLVDLVEKIMQGGPFEAKVYVANNLIENGHINLEEYESFRGRNGRLEPYNKPYQFFDHLIAFTIKAWQSKKEVQMDGDKMELYLELGRREEQVEEIVQALENESVEGALQDAVNLIGTIRRAFRKNYREGERSWSMFWDTTKGRIGLGSSDADFLRSDLRRFIREAMAKGSIDRNARLAILESLLNSYKKTLEVRAVIYNIQNPYP